MIGVGTSLLFDRRAGKAGPPIPPFNKAMVDAWFMSGLSNIDKPSSIKGVMGNEMALKNFTYSLSSGFGKYEVDFNSFSFDNKRGEIYRASNTIILKKSNIAIFPIIYTFTLNSSFKIKVSNVSEEHTLQIDNDNARIKISKDGIYTIPVPSSGYLGFGTKNILDSCNITITQLPSAYEGALVFDGVDDYGMCTGLPIMDDFTLICKREILNTAAPGYVANKGLGNAGAFHFESSIQTSDSNSTTGVWSYGTGNRVKLEESEVSWMTKNSYNGIELKTGNLSDVDQLYLCRFSSSYTKAAIYYFALYNKSLTVEEIETEKERLNEEWLKRKTE